MNCVLRATVAAPKMLRRNGPGEIFVAQGDIEHSFRGQNVEREAAFTQSNAEKQLAALAKVEEIAREAKLKDASVAGLEQVFGMQQADAALLEDALAKGAILNAQGDARLARIPNGDPELEIAHIGDGFGQRVHAKIKIRGIEAVGYLVEGADAAVHSAAAAVGGVEARAHPFEVSGFAPVHCDREIGRRRLAAAVLGCALDGMRERVRAVFADGGVDFGKVLAEKCVEFRVVRGTVLGSER